MKRSIDIANEKEIFNPRILDWNIVADQWKWNEDKKCYISIEYHFTEELVWEKFIVEKKEIDNT
jgi:hypothetical protein